MMLVIAGIAAAFVWRSVSSLPAQYVTISGQTYRFAGVSYGTNHVIGSMFGRLVYRLPRPVAGIVRAFAGSSRSQTAFTAKPSVFIWLEPQGPATPVGGGTTIYAMLADEHGAIGGEEYFDIRRSGRISRPFFILTFEVLPRRGRTLDCVFYVDGDSGGLSPRREIGRIRLANPLYRRYPDWQPESLPATKTNGNVVVELENFVSGVAGSKVTGSDGHSSRTFVHRRAGVGEEPQAAFDLNVQCPGNTNEVWEPKGAEFSDATGNKIGTWGGGAEGHNWFQPTLWPSETAWRLKLELKRDRGFTQDELVAFHGVPVPAIGSMNNPCLTNIVDGLEIDVTGIERGPIVSYYYDNNIEASAIHVHHAPVPEGLSFDFVAIETDDHRELKPISSRWMWDACDIWVEALPTNVTRLNMTFAVQKTRTVEFMVKP